MSTFNEMLQKYVNRSYDELLQIANLSMKDLVPALNKKFNDNDVTAKFLTILTCACLDTDGEISNLEISFLNDLLGSNYTREGMYDIIKGLGDEKGREIVDQIADLLDADGKASLISLCLCFLSVDETITRKEIAYISKLIE